jgi:predicted cupin superfamily sugar epimerase
MKNRRRIEEEDDDEGGWYEMRREEKRKKGVYNSSLESRGTTRPYLTHIYFICYLLFYYFFSKLLE